MRYICGTNGTLRKIQLVEIQQAAMDEHGTGIFEQHCQRNVPRDFILGYVTRGRGVGRVREGGRAGELRERERARATGTHVCGTET